MRMERDALGLASTPGNSNTEHMEQQKIKCVTAYSSKEGKTDVRKHKPL